MDDTATALRALGWQLPGPGYFAAAIVFGLIGLAAFRLGRRRARPVATWTGLALMLYPYAIERTWVLVVVGLALCAVLAWDHWR